MNIFKKKKEEQRTSGAFLTTKEAYDMLCCEGYTRLDRNPEIITACHRIADLVSSMTIYLMSNTEKGDVRIKNELSRHIDIYPNKYMTRKSWMHTIVMNMLLYGDGNAVVIPNTNNGILGDLVPVDPSSVSFIPDGYGYKILISGQEVNPDDVMHFVLNPDSHYSWKGQGFTASIKEVANNLKQARATEKGLLSAPKPSVIVKVDGLIDEFSSPEGRKKLLDEYIKTSEDGEPWLIPAEQFGIDQVRPLTIADLAIKDTVELNKKTVASILGVPSFLLGVDSYNAQEWDNFISSTIKSIAQEIEQEMTRKLLLSQKWYFKFNVSSLYSYDLQKIASVYKDLRAIGIVTGNEVRDKLGMSRMEGLDELVMLENYIPTDKLGEQNKLSQEEENAE